MNSARAIALTAMMVLCVVLPTSASAANEGQRCTASDGPPNQILALCTAAIRAAGALYSQAYFLKRAKAYEDNNNLELALRDYDAATKAIPPSGVVYYKRGEFLNSKMKDRDGALRDFEQAFSLDPRQLEARFGRASLLFDRGDYSTVLAELARAEGLGPSTGLAVQIRQLRAMTLEAMKSKGLPDAQEAPAVAQAPAVSQQVIAALPAVQPEAKAAQSPPPKRTDPDSRGNRVALVIGNSNYRSVAALPNPARDAANIANALRETGFQSVDLITNTTRESLIEAIRQFSAKADLADWR